MCFISSIHAPAFGSVASDVEKVPTAMSQYPKTIRIDCHDLSNIAFDNLLKELQNIPEVYTANTVVWNDQQRFGKIELQVDPVIGSSDLIWSYVKSRLGHKLNLKERNQDKIILTAFHSNTRTYEGG